MDTIHNEKMDALMRAIISLKSEKEAYDFMEDLCSITELKAMEQRFTVALMLDRKIPYSTIVRETGASTTTISRVNRSLQYGKEGYRQALENMKNAEDKNVQ